ncbi:putative NADPH-dependent FMN/FAD containing oxidoreductase [Calycina marina]|uniref:NADPH-dependent diflavin oxidoreductase 1 n=1 Tax=Calycina marina TaxID=1763456 RepID=A0A9P7Z3C2_9HELO|nr:putative NADPH-dependent FMN/FAD containing oxidoreductase [Calycina marina]
MAEGQRHDRSVLIIYGSETGNSQDAAEELGRVVERLHFATRVSEMDSVEIYTIVICVVSTTGQGEFPNNARRLWRSLLRKSLRPRCLGHVSFTTFGLGDSSYAKFNWAARKLHKRLSQLGASDVYPRGEGDEQHDEGIEGTFLPWSADLGRHLLTSYPLPEGVSPIPDDVLLPPKHHLVVAKENTVEEGFISGSLPNAAFDHTLLPIPSRITAKLKGNLRVTPPNHWQDVRHLFFSIPEEEAPNYMPGDVLTLYPKNFPSDVQDLNTLMNWNDITDQTLALEGDYPHNSLFPLPNTTLRQLLTHNLDITAIPKRYFFHQISHYTSDEMHKERLLEFCNPIYTDEFYDYTTRPRRSILEVLQDFPTVKLPWQHATSIFPPIRGRQFSIASGGYLKYNLGNGFVQIELLVAIVRYKTILRKIREGLCSRYIASLPIGTELAVSFEKNEKFYDLVKREPARPIIMIAPGTGVAPCRSLMYQRRVENPTTGPTHLFFGNRNRGADFFFVDEWPFFSESLTIHTAFSRDQLQKIYIQDIIRQQGTLVKKLILDGAVVFVCGSSGAMPKAVRAALMDALASEDDSKNGESSESDLEEKKVEAESILKSMEDRGRFVQETW